MNERGRDFLIRTHGGAYDLSRVVNLLALLDLTPRTLDVRADGCGLRVRLRLAADERACARFVNRLRALPAVIEARPDREAAT